MKLADSDSSRWYPNSNIPWENPDSGQGMVFYHFEDEDSEELCIFVFVPEAFHLEEDCMWYGWLCSREQHAWHRARIRDGIRDTAIEQYPEAFQIPCLYSRNLTRSLCTEFGITVKNKPPFYDILRHKRELTVKSLTTPKAMMELLGFITWTWKDTAAKNFSNIIEQYVCKENILKAEM